jgi:Zn-dependent metalloprotease
MSHSITYALFKKNHEGKVIESDDEFIQFDFTADEITIDFYSSPNTGNIKETIKFNFTKCGLHNIILLYNEDYKLKVYIENNVIKFSIDKNHYYGDRVWIEQTRDVISINELIQKLKKNKQSVVGNLKGAINGLFKTKKGGNKITKKKSNKKPRKKSKPKPKTSKKKSKKKKSKKKPKKKSKKKKSK